MINSFLSHWWNINMNIRWIFSHGGIITWKIMDPGGGYVVAVLDWVMSYGVSEVTRHGSSALKCYSYAGFMINDISTNAETCC